MSDQIAGKMYFFSKYVYNPKGSGQGQADVWMYHLEEKEADIGMFCAKPIIKDGLEKEGGGAMVQRYNSIKIFDQRTTSANHLIHCKMPPKLPEKFL